MIQGQIIHSKKEGKYYFIPDPSPPYIVVNSPKELLELNLDLESVIGHAEAYVNTQFGVSYITNLGGTIKNVLFMNFGFLWGTALSSPNLYMTLNLVNCIFVGYVNPSRVDYGVWAASTRGNPTVNFYSCTFYNHLLLRTVAGTSPSMTHNFYDCISNGNSGSGGRMTENNCAWDVGDINADKFFKSPSNTYKRGFWSKPRI